MAQPDENPRGPPPAKSRIASAASRYEGELYFGQSKTDFAGALGYAEFLYTVTNPILVREPTEGLKERNVAGEYIDEQTEAVRIVSVFPTPATHAISTQLKTGEISAKIVPADTYSSKYKSSFTSVIAILVSTQCLETLLPRLQ